MTVGVVPNVAELRMLTGIRAVNPNWVVQLYINDVTPGPGSVLADFDTNLPNPMFPFTWPLTPITTDADGKGQFAELVVEWPAPDTEEVTIYGIIAVDSTNHLFGAKKWEAPITMVPGGLPLRVRCSLKLWDANQP